MGQSTDAYLYYGYTWTEYTEDLEFETDMDVGIEWDPQKYRSGDQEAAWRVAHAYMGFEMRTLLAAPEAVAERA